MKKRLYFVLPNLNEAKMAVDELLLARIEESNIHVMARDDVDLGDLPEASLFQKSDIVHGVEMGLVVGGLAGLTASLVIVLQMEAIMGLVVLGCTLFGAGFGMWTSAMIASNIKNTRLERFERQLENGKILLMADVRLDRLDRVNRRMHAHSQVVFAGEETSMPAFP